MVLAHLRFVVRLHLAPDASCMCRSHSDIMQNLPITLQLQQTTPRPYIFAMSRSAGESIRELKELRSTTKISRSGFRHDARFSVEAGQELNDLQRCNISLEARRPCNIPIHTDTTSGEAVQPRPQPNGLFAHVCVSCPSSCSFQHQSSKMYHTHPLLAVCFLDFAGSSGVGTLCRQTNHQCAA